MQAFFRLTLYNLCFRSTYVGPQYKHIGKGVALVMVTAYYAANLLCAVANFTYITQASSLFVGSNSILSCDKHAFIGQIYWTCNKYEASVRLRYLTTCLSTNRQGMQLDLHICVCLITIQRNFSQSCKYADRSTGILLPNIAYPGCQSFLTHTV